jgi:hypothetical protein
MREYIVNVVVDGLHINFLHEISRDRLHILYVCSFLLLLGRPRL